MNQNDQDFFVSIHLSPIAEVGNRTTIKFEHGKVLGHRVDVGDLVKRTFKSPNGFGSPCDKGPSRCIAYTSNMNFDVRTLPSKRIT